MHHTTYKTCYKILIYFTSVILLSVKCFICTTCRRARYSGFPLHKVALENTKVSVFWALLASLHAVIWFNCCWVCLALLAVQQSEVWKSSWLPSTIDVPGSPSGFQDLATILPASYFKSLTACDFVSSGKYE